MLQPVVDSADQQDREGPADVGIGQVLGVKHGQKKGMGGREEVDIGDTIARALRIPQKPACPCFHVVRRSGPNKLYKQLY